MTLRDEVRELAHRKLGPHATIEVREVGPMVGDPCFCTTVYVVDKFARRTSVTVRHHSKPGAIEAETDLALRVMLGGLRELPDWSPRKMETPSGKELEI